MIVNIADKTETLADVIRHGKVVLFASKDYNIGKNAIVQRMSINQRFNAYYAFNIHIS